ncbi:MAG: 7-carboxy-7-deazaguanine synthase QueE [Planctomycetota bacterium]
MKAQDGNLSGQVAEVFRSYQGEGLLLGRRQVFVRLAGCAVGCRFCDTAWAFETPPSVTGPRDASGAVERLTNPLSVQQVVDLVQAVDPPGAPGGPCPVSITGGEPCEQPDFVAALVEALAPRPVMLETAGLHLQALQRLAPRCRWVASDIKLPTATGLPDVLARHEAVLQSGVLKQSETFFKLVVDGETPEAELDAAAELLARHHPQAPVFLQPVTPLGGSPALPRARFDALVDRLASRGLSVRLVPQVHKALGVR